MKDIHNKEIKPNDTVRFTPKGSNYPDEYVIDGIDDNFVAMHNVFCCIVIPKDSGTFEVLPERVLTKEDFKSKRE